MDWAPTEAFDLIFSERATEPRITVANQQYVNSLALRGMRVDCSGPRGHLYQHCPPFIFHILHVCVVCADCIGLGQERAIGEKRRVFLYPALEPFNLLFDRYLYYPTDKPLLPLFLHITDCAF
jgi:hypothetical protein